MDQQTIPPWYKQFWPWFLISIPATSIVLSFIMITKAVNQPHKMVSDSYYKEGLDINQDLSLDKNADMAGISASLSTNEAGNTIYLNLAIGTESLPNTVVVKLEHPTLDDKDATLQLMGSGDNYQTTIAEPILGKRYITIQPLSGNWQIRGEVNLPNPTGTTLKPLVY